MTIELSLVPASPDWNSIEIVPGDITGISDVDRVRFLQEAEEGRYSRVFAFQRETNTESLIGDLGVLEDCSRGVYILIQTDWRKMRCKVFVGMTEDYKRVIDLYEAMKGANQRIEVFDPVLTLDQCLIEQNQKPPVGMSNWDLAIVIPEHENTALLYSMLLAIFDEAEGFDLKKRLNKSTKFDLRRMHDNHYYFFGSPETVALLLNSDFFPTDLDSWVSVLCGLTYLCAVISSPFRRKSSSRKKKPEKPEEGFVQNIIVKIEGDVIIGSNITHGKNSPINIEVKNSNDSNLDTAALIKYLNGGFPPKSDTLSW